jgi:hypothetical protein
VSSPVANGRGYGAGWNGLAAAVFGGWALEGIAQWLSGANAGSAAERPNRIRNPNQPKW